tara:strand:- start:68095 stop:68325 length:231 start_codon:yes stop_codon:yes gene_type:complete
VIKWQVTVPRQLLVWQRLPDTDFAKKVGGSLEAIPNFHENGYLFQYLLVKLDIGTYESHSNNCPVMRVPVPVSVSK